jgi:putative ABC transport system permease protein
VNTTSLSSLLTGVQTLRANPLRTVLSTLGVIIGVAALVAILALGDGLEAFSRDQIATTTSIQYMSVNPITVERADGILVRREKVEVLEPAHAHELAQRLAGLADVTMHMTGSTFARVAGDTARHAVFIEATLPGSFVLADLGLTAGTWFTVRNDTDIVLSDLLAEALATGPPATLVGNTVQLGDASYTVAGVIASRAGDRIARVYAPLSPAIAELLGGVERRPPGLLIHVERVEDVPRVEEETGAWLRERFGSGAGFEIGSSRARVAQTSRAILVFKLAMGSITGISILVGGIGIMNILIASVHERTREIGVRRAAGARQRDIFLQFLAESVTIAAAGSMLGVVVGLAGAFGITALIRRMADAPVYAAFDWTTVGIAAIVAVVVGMAFGTYPARFASRLSPIDAIRHE